MTKLQETVAEIEKLGDVYTEELKRLLMLQYLLNIDKNMLEDHLRMMDQVLTNWIDKLKANEDAHKADLLRGALKKIHLIKEHPYDDDDSLFGIGIT